MLGLTTVLIYLFEANDTKLPSEYKSFLSRQSSPVLPNRLPVRIMSCHVVHTLTMTVEEVA